MKISQLVIVFSRLRCNTGPQIILLVILEGNLIKMESVIVRLQYYYKSNWTFFDYDLCTGREVKYSSIHSRTEEGPHLIE